MYKVACCDFTRLPRIDSLISLCDFPSGSFTARTIMYVSKQAHCAASCPVCCKNIINYNDHYRIGVKTTTMTLKIKCQYTTPLWVVLLCCQATLSAEFMSFSLANRIGTGANLIMDPLPTI